MAAHLAIGEPFDDVGSPVDPATLVRLAFAIPEIRADALDSSVLYIDSFGNLRLAGDPGVNSPTAFARSPGRMLELEFVGNGTAPIRERAAWARTFGEIPIGAPLVYEDSFGRLAYADNQGNVAARLGVTTGRPVRIRPIPG